MTINKMIRTIGELAIELPGATRFFEKLGIDYRREGVKPLSQTSSIAVVTGEPVLTRSTKAETQSDARREAERWETAPLSDLMKHVVRNHHDAARAALLRLRELLADLCSAHSRNHPGLFSIRDLFFRLEADLTNHMIGEERILFPHIEALATFAGPGDLKPAIISGTVLNPIGVMMQEHDDACQTLRQLRELTTSHQVPDNDGVSFCAFYQALGKFESDLHQQIQLENDILFRRAVELEGGN